MTTNPLPAHSTHVVPPSPGDIHHIDLIEDDNIHMLSWDDGLPEPIVLHDSYEIDGVSFQAPTPFSLIPDEAPFQLTQLAPKPAPQPVPPRFILYLHCSYHQGSGHDTDHCNALRHAIQDLIDQGWLTWGSRV